MELAIKNQTRYYEYWLEMLENRRRTPPESKVSTNAAERSYFATCMQELSKAFRIFSRKQIIERTQWNDGDNRLKDNLGSAIQEGKLKVYVLDDSREIINRHKEDQKWLKERKIASNFKTPPHLYEWVGKND